MDTCKVKLTISRAGVTVDQKRGDIVEVGLLEAGRLQRQGSIEPLDAKTLKAIAAAEAAAAQETAAGATAADVETAAGATAADVETAQADVPEGETAAAGEGEGETETAGG